MFTIEPPCSSREEVPDRLAGAQERAAQVHGQHAVEVRARELLARPRDLDAGVVDEHVEPAEALGGLADHAHDVVLVGDVAADEHVAHALLAHLAHARVDLLLGVVRLLGLAQVVDRDVGAVLGEAHGDRLADPGAAAGDEHVLALAGRAWLRCGLGGERLDIGDSSGAVSGGASRATAAAVTVPLGARSSSSPASGKSSTESRPAPISAALAGGVDQARAPARSPWPRR